jgi:hypothetical protein
MNNKKNVTPQPPATSESPAAPNAVDYKKTIDNHTQAAFHHTEAARHHLDAAKAYSEENPEKAAHSAMLARGHHAIAGEFINDDAKHHAQMLKRTNDRRTGVRPPSQKPYYPL